MERNNRRRDLNLQLRNSQKSYRWPSTFIHIASSWDGSVTRTLNEEYSQNPEKTGIGEIDGLFLYMKDWTNSSEALGLNYGSFGSRSLRDRVIQIDPAFDLLLRGSQPVRKQMMKLGFFDESIDRDVTEIIQSRVTSTKKTEAIISKIYPKLDVGQILNSINYQLKNKLTP